MAEPLRKEDELTTADLAGRSEKPQLVRNARQDEIESSPGDGDISRTAVADKRSAEVAEPSPLFSDSEIGDFRSRWNSIQTGFVDEPRRAVEDADGLVAQLMKKLAEGFANERQRLEKHWDSGENVSTEDLRIALQRYRSFFDRLLKA